MLHRGDRRTLTTKKVRETEAEAVAFVIGKAIGLETGTASADYIQLWHGDANLLRESLEAVQQTAAVVGDEWSDYLPDSAPLISDWRAPMSCGNFNTKTGVCGGATKVAVLDLSALARLSARGAAKRTKE